MNFPEWALLSSEPPQTAVAVTVPAGIVGFFVRKADLGVVFAMPKSVYSDAVFY